METKTTNETVEVAEPQGVEIDGDTFTDMEDYTGIVAIEESPLEIIDENGLRVTDNAQMRNGEYITSPLSETWHYAWVTNEHNPTGSRVEKMKQLFKYEIVTERTEPKVTVPASTSEARKQHKGAFVVNELTLMRCPRKAWDAQQKVFTDRDKRRMKSIRRNLEGTLNQVGGFYGKGVEIRRSRPR